MANNEQFHTEITADGSQYEAAMNKMAESALTADQRIQSGFRDMQVQIATSMQQVQNQAEAAVKKVGESTGSIMSNMQATISKEMALVTGTLGKIQTMAAGVGALILGGGAFGEAVGKSAELTKESQALGRALGMTATDASILKVALGDVFVSQDALMAGNKAMTRTLKDNEQAVKDLGVETRDGNGHFRESFEIMTDVNKKLLEFKEGTDRNIEGQKVYKKSWEEVAPTLKLNAEVIEAARQKAIALNLVVGEENVVATKAYRSAMNDVGDVLLAVKKAIGDAVMPVLTDLGEWFASTGPQRVEYTRKAMAGLVAGFYGIKMAVEIVWETIKSFIESFAIAIAAMGLAFAKIVQLDFTGAGAEIDRGTAAIGDRLNDAGEKWVKDAEHNRDKIMAALSMGFDDPTVTPTAKGKSTGTSDGGKEKEGKSRMAFWEEKLAAERDAEDKTNLMRGSFQQYTIQQESAFWQKILDIKDLTDREKAAVSRKYYAAEREVRKQAFEAELAENKAKLETYRKGSAERIEIAGQIAAKTIERYGWESKEAKAAMAEMTQMSRERYEQERQLQELAVERERALAMSRVELERQNLDRLEALGVIKANEKLAALRNLKQIEYAIDLQAEADKAALLEDDAIAYQKHLDKIQQMKEKHELDMQKLDTQIAVERKKTMDQWLDPLGQATQTLMQGFIQGSQTWQQVLGNALRNVGTQYATMLLNLGFQWLKTQLFMTQATAVGTAERGAIEAGAAAESQGISVLTALKNIAVKAWEAAANVYASEASVPYIGPFLAPGMALAAAGTVMGFAGNIASAAGGFSVPSGLNPVTQLHEEEMVLPKDLSNAVRDMADGSGGGGEIHLHVHANDSKDARRFLLENRHAVSDAVQKSLRETGVKR